MNVLVIAPHPDDEAIGCGGTLLRHADEGDRIAVVFLTSGELGLKHLEPEQAWGIREAEARAAAATLGIAALEFLRQPDWFVGERIRETGAALRPLLERHAPELVYLPHPGEWHPDHQAALPVLRQALGPNPAAGLLLRGYEIWTPMAEYDHVEDITERMARKLRAVRGYRSQLTELRYDRAIRGLNQYRGLIAARCRYAEVFRDLAVRKGAS